MTVIGGDSITESDKSSINNPSTNSLPRSTSSASSSDALKTDHLSSKYPKTVMDSDYKYQFTASTITGVLHIQNAGAFDWSINGFLAYGCQNKIVVLDTNNTMKYCQSKLFCLCYVIFTFRNKF